MKFLLPIALLASAAAAQSTTAAAAPTPSSACQAAYILEACLGTQNTRLAGCSGTDYGCQCAAYGDILTCYNNCPDDTRKPIAEGQRQIFCQYASQFPSSTAGAPSSTGSPAAANTGASQSSSSSSAAAPSSTGSPNKTSSAMELAFNAGGLLAAVAGVVVAVL